MRMKHYGFALVALAVTSLVGVSALCFVIAVACGIAGGGLIAAGMDREYNAKARAERASRKALKDVYEAAGLTEKPVAGLTLMSPAHLSRSDLSTEEMLEDTYNELARVEAKLRKAGRW